MGFEYSKVLPFVRPSPPPSPPQSLFRPPPPNPELDEPWRRFDWGKKEALKQKLENFTPSRPDVEEIKILVAGQIGAGKSSFINSVESAFRGRICARALVNSAASGHSFTQRFKGFPIKIGGRTLPFVFKDVMGLEPDTLAGSQIEDIINAVFGHLKDGYKFNQEQPLTLRDPDFNRDPTLSEKTFCLVYVIDGSTVSFADDKLIDKLKIIRQRISDAGIPQVIVMTKVDEVCPLVQKDLKKIYKSKKIKEKMELCSVKVGVPMTNIFPVKNYHEEIDTDDNLDALILKALEQIVQSADDRLMDSESY